MSAVNFSESSGNNSDDSSNKKKPSPLSWFRSDEKPKDEKDDPKSNDKSAKARTGTSPIRRRRNIKFDNVKEDGNFEEVDDAYHADSMESANEIEDLNERVRDLVRFQIPKPSETIVLPYTGRPLFPGFTQAHIIKHRSVFEQIIKMQKNGPVYVGMFYWKNGNELGEEIDPEFKQGDLSPVGTFASIEAINPILPTVGTPKKKAEEPAADADHTEKDLHSANEWTVILKGHRRIEMLELLSEKQPLFARIDHVRLKPMSFYKEDEIRGYVNLIRNTLHEVAPISSNIIVDLRQFRYDERDCDAFADFAATVTSASPEDLQEVLCELDLGKRLNLSLLLLKKEQKIVQLQREINQQVEKKVNESQRKYFLRQQLKQIQQELGVENDDKSALIAKFEEKIDELNKIAEEQGIEFPKDADRVIKEEMEKLNSLDKDSSEFQQTRRYLEWLTDIPWTKYSPENYDLLHAHRILERDHYGLEDIKERIMEYIAVGKLRGEIKGKILLFVGPPGVGKTSIGKSIASALGREFYRFSVGGLSDVSEIKGHRRTYVGAMPGKIVQCLKQVKTMNPLILIDEIDKLSSGYRGDPASALLELLDPSQNTSFLDHYLDVPVDVSKVLFVCTANMLDTIPGPLLDRMEVLRLSGYDLPEKVNIAQNYLVPRAKKDSGILIKDKQQPGEDTEENPKMKLNTSVDVNMSKDALESLTRWYCRESGVRRLEQMIDRIYRKVALLLVRNTGTEEIPIFAGNSKSAKKQLALPDSGTYEIKEEDLESLVGKPIFSSDRMYNVEIPPGVVMGLAYTSFGGSSLYIETTNVKKVKSAQVVKDDKKPPSSGGRLIITGKLGDVMKESSTISFTNARHILNSLQPENDFFETNDIHLHVPEGATPKDGPSAGVTMTTALLSLAMGKSVSPDLAMTGEISLTGMVLPVGGIKEKVIAARRSGVTHVVLPDGNRKDVDELPDYLKDDLDIHFAKTYQDVYSVAFRENN